MLVKPQVAYQGRGGEVEFFQIDGEDIRPAVFNVFAPAQLEDDDGLYGTVSVKRRVKRTPGCVHGPLEKGKVYSTSAHIWKQHRFKTPFERPANQKYLHAMGFFFADVRTDYERDGNAQTFAGLRTELTLNVEDFKLIPHMFSRYYRIIHEEVLAPKKTISKAKLLYAMDMMLFLARAFSCFGGRYEEKPSVSKLVIYNYVLNAFGITGYSNSALVARENAWREFVGSFLSESYARRSRPEDLQATVDRLHRRFEKAFPRTFDDVDQVNDEGDADAAVEEVPSRMTHEQVVDDIMRNMYMWEWKHPNKKLASSFAASTLGIVEGESGVVPKSRIKEEFFQIDGEDIRPAVFNVFAPAQLEDDDGLYGTVSVKRRVKRTPGCVHGPLEKGKVYSTSAHIWKQHRFKTPFERPANQKYLHAMGFFFADVRTDYERDGNAQTFAGLRTELTLNVEDFKLIPHMFSRYYRIIHEEVLAPKKTISKAKLLYAMDMMLFLAHAFSCFGGRYEEKPSVSKIVIYNYVLNAFGITGYSNSALVARENAWREFSNKGAPHLNKVTLDIGYIEHLASQDVMLVKPQVAYQGRGGEVEFFQIDGEDIRPAVFNVFAPAQLEDDDGLYGTVSVKRRVKRTPGCVHGPLEKGKVYSTSAHIWKQHRFKTPFERPANQKYLHAMGFFFADVRTDYERDGNAQTFAGLRTELTLNVEDFKLIPHMFSRYYRIIHEEVLAPKKTISKAKLLYAMDMMLFLARAFSCFGGRYEEKPSVSKIVIYNYVLNAFGITGYSNSALVARENAWREFVGSFLSESYARRSRPEDLQATVDRLHRRFEKAFPRTFDDVGQVNDEGDADAAVEEVPSRMTHEQVVDDIMRNMYMWEWKHPNKKG
eukprot:jgi/Phyca11/18616/fgenesh1_pg.PHYCAscaffold_38_\